MMGVQKKEGLFLSRGSASGKIFYFIWILKNRNGVRGADSEEWDSKWRYGNCKTCVTGKGL